MTLKRDNELGHPEWAKEVTVLTNAGPLFLQLEFPTGRVRAKLSHAHVDGTGNIVLQQESVPGYPNASDIHVEVQPKDTTVYKRMSDGKGGVVLCAEIVITGRNCVHRSHFVHVSNRYDSLAAEEEAEETGLPLQ